MTLEIEVTERAVMGAPTKAESEYIICVDGSIGISVRLKVKATSEAEAKIKATDYAIELFESVTEYDPVANRDEIEDVERLGDWNDFYFEGAEVTGIDIEAIEDA